MSAKPGQPKHQVHGSGINLAAKCGQAYFYRYVQGIKSPPAGAMIAGTACHAGREVDMHRVIDTGELAPIEEVLDEVSTRFNEKWEKAREVQVRGDEGRNPRAYYLERSVRLGRIHHLDIAPKLRPRAVESSFSIKVAETNVELVGRIDLEEHAEEGEGYVISDAKNVRKSPQGDEADRSLQLTAYAVAGHTLYGEFPRRLFLDFAIDKKVPDAKRLETLRGNESVGPLHQRLVSIDKALKSGDFAPASPDAWWCSRDWCGYWDRCPFAVKPVSIGTGTGTGGI